MFEEYMKTSHTEEQSRAFALDCVLRLVGEQGEKLMEGKDWAAERIVDRAKVFEAYLAEKADK